jgi:hypothetical protein
MQYFVRTMDVCKESHGRGSVPTVKRIYPELACAALGQAIDQAKRRVLESDRTTMLQADACSRNRDQVRTKYRCWIDERGAFNELSLAARFSCEPNRCWPVKAYFAATAKLPGPRNIACRLGAVVAASCGHPNTRHR